MHVDPTPAVMSARKVRESLNEISAVAGKQAARMIPIEDIDCISSRAFAALWDRGIFRLGDIEKMSTEELLEVPHVGRWTVREIRRFMEPYGLDIRAPDRFARHRASYAGAELIPLRSIRGLSTRALRGLMDVEAEFLGDLQYITHEEALRLPDVGQKALENMCAVLEAHGLALADGSLRDATLARLRTTAARLRKRKRDLERRLEAVRSEIAELQHASH